MTARTRIPASLALLFVLAAYASSADACGCKGGSKPAPSRPPHAAPQPSPAPQPAPAPRPAPAPTPSVAAPAPSAHGGGGTSSLPPGHPLTWPDPVPPTLTSTPRPEPEVIFVPVPVEVPAEPVVITISTAYAVPGPERIVYVDRPVYLDRTCTPPPKPLVPVKRKPAKVCK